ncbi:MAG TPA: NfeD family protein [Jatrophihabitans sp.]|nr:NfeD family protein [Jatrophihabitans sp.]
MDAWLIWLILAAVLAGAEALSLDLVLIMLAGGALAGSATAAVGLPPAVQVAVAIGGALALLVAVRPVAKRHLTAHEHPMGTDALVGKEAIVLSRVDAAGGRVRLNGSEWSARASDHKQVIEAGTTVQVIEIAGATAVVWDSSHDNPYKIR